MSQQDELTVGAEVTIDALGSDWPTDSQRNLPGVVGRVKGVHGPSGDRQYLVGWGQTIQVTPMSQAQSAWFARHELRG